MLAQISATQKESKDQSFQGPSSCNNCIAKVTYFQLYRNFEKQNSDIQEHLVKYCVVPSYRPNLQIGYQKLSKRYAMQWYVVSTDRFYLLLSKSCYILK